MDVSAGVVSANSTLTKIQNTAALLRTQQSQLNATLTNIAENVRSNIESCSRLNCATLRSSLNGLHTGTVYSVCCKHPVFIIHWSQLIFLLHLHNIFHLIKVYFFDNNSLRFNRFCILLNFIHINLVPSVDQEQSP